MAKATCPSCGARFDIEGAVGSLEEHQEAFHPDAAARTPARERGSRSADAASAADSGGSDQGGDASPAGDPEAQASGEAGTPPDGA